MSISLYIDYTYIVGLMKLLHAYFLLSTSPYHFWICIDYERIRSWYVAFYFWRYSGFELGLVASLLLFCVQMILSIYSRYHFYHSSFWLLDRLFSIFLIFFLIANSSLFKASINCLTMWFRCLLLWFSGSLVSLDSLKLLFSHVSWKFFCLLS